MNHAELRPYKKKNKKYGPYCGCVHYSASPSFCFICLGYLINMRAVILAIIFFFPPCTSAASLTLKPLTVVGCTRAGTAGWPAGLYVAAEYTHSSLYKRLRARWVQRGLCKKAFKEKRRREGGPPLCSAESSTISGSPLPEHSVQLTYTCYLQSVGGGYSTFSLYNESNGWWLQYFKRAC